LQECLKHLGETNKVEEEAIMEPTNARFFSSSLFFFSHINECELISYLCAFVLLILEKFFKHFWSYFKPMPIRPLKRPPLQEITKKYLSKMRAFEESKTKIGGGYG
jgi:hypothetical protein